MAYSEALILVERSWYWASTGPGFDVVETALYFQILSVKDNKTHLRDSCKKCYLCLLVADFSTQSYG